MFMSNPPELFQLETEMSLTSVATLGLLWLFFFFSKPRLLPTVARWMFSLPEKRYDICCFHSWSFFFCFFFLRAHHVSGRYSSDAVWYTHIHSAWYFIGSQCVGAPFLSCIINPKSFLFNLVRFNSSYLNKDYLKRKKKIPSRKAVKVSLEFFFPPWCSF